MFSDGELVRNQNITIGNTDTLKLPNFYSLTQDNKINEWKKIASYPAISCHRQCGFDFNTIEKVSVISIKVNQRQWLYNRVKHVHWSQHDIGNPLIKQLYSIVPEKDQDKIIEADYQSWIKKNILDSDDILDFEILLNDSIYEWCERRQLKVNLDYLKVIREELIRYQ
jgi:hypothetical protein